MSFEDQDDSLTSQDEMGEILKKKPPPISKLPVELFQYIMRIASSTPGCEEYGNNPYQHLKFQLLEGESTSFMEEEELRLAVACRLSLSLVCRHWLTVIEPILWSHIYPAPRHFNGLLDTITHNPVLATHIKRITIKYTDLNILWDWEYNSVLSKQTSVLPFILLACPRVTIVDTLMIAVNLEAVGENVRHLNLSFDSSRTATSIGRDAPLIFSNLTSLNIKLLEWRIDDIDVNPVELPALQALGIWAPLYAHWNLETIMEFWQLPRVTALSVFGGRAVAVLKIIRKLAATLETLHIANSYCERWDSGRIELPKLNRLEITWTKMSEELLNVLFPEGFGFLRVVGVYWPEPAVLASEEIDDGAYDQRICRSLEVIGGLCPETTRICLSGARLNVHAFMKQKDIYERVMELKQIGRVIELISYDGVAHSI